MSLREDIIAELSDFNVSNVKVNRDIEEKGSPTTEVIVYWKTDNDKKLWSRSTFGKSTGLNGAEMGKIMASYMRSGFKTDATNILEEKSQNEGK